MDTFLRLPFTSNDPRCRMLRRVLQGLKFPGGVLRSAGAAPARGMSDFPGDRVDARADVAGAVLVAHEGASLDTDGQTLYGIRLRRALDAIAAGGTLGATLQADAVEAETPAHFLAKAQERFALLAIDR